MEKRFKIRSICNLLFKSKGKGKVQVSQAKVAIVEDPDKELHVIVMDPEWTPEKALEEPILARNGNS